MNDTASASSPMPLSGLSADSVRLRTGRAEECLCFYPALFQLGACEAEGDKIDLGFSGGRLLERLLMNPGEVVSRDDLLEYAWPGRVVGQGSLNQQIYTLRQLFCDEKGREIIQTLPRRGYLFNPLFIDCPETPEESATLRPEALVPSSTAVDTPPFSQQGFSGRGWLLGLAGFCVLMLAAVVLLIRDATPEPPAPVERRSSYGLLEARLHAADDRMLDYLEENARAVLERAGELVDAPRTVLLRREESYYRLICDAPDATPRWLLIHAAQIKTVADAQLRRCLS